MSVNQEVSAKAGNVEGIFSHGLQFLYPRSEEGPSIYAILEGAWLGAALVKGIRSKVWECDPTKPNPIAAAWAGAGLLAVKTVEAGEMAGAVYCSLTSAGQRVVACADLLEYEYSMIQQQLDANYVTDPAKYKSLRRGLENYAGAFIPDMVDWVSRGGDAPMGVDPLMASSVESRYDYGVYKSELRGGGGLAIRGKLALGGISCASRRLPLRLP